MTLVVDDTLEAQSPDVRITTAVSRDAFNVPQTTQHYFISREVARRKMARLKGNTNIILRNSLDDINRIPLIMHYRTSYGTFIPEITMPTNDLCIALVTVADKVAARLKLDFQKSFDMIKNAFFSNNTSDGFEISVQSLLLLQVEYDDKSQKGTARTVLNRLAGAIDAKITLIAKQVYRHKITSVMDPFQSILITFPDATAPRREEQNQVGDLFDQGNGAQEVAFSPDIYKTPNSTPVKKIRLY